MMGTEDINDRYSLEAWLKNRPEDYSIVIARRAALRVLPVWGRAMNRHWSRGAELTALQPLRCLGHRSVAQLDPTTEVLTNVDSRATGPALSAAWLAYDNGYYDYNKMTADAALRVNDPIQNRNAQYGNAASYAGRAAANVYALYGESSAEHAAAAAAALADEPVTKASATESVWEQIRNDAALLDQGNDVLAHHPLWQGAPPAWFTTSDAEMRAIWAADPPDHWAFWTRWWDAAKAGKPLNWNLQHDIALISDAIWKAGPGPVAEAIAAIELRHAIAATPNGETVELNPATGRLRLVPVSNLPADIATYARRKIMGAVNLFGDAGTNQYAALAPDLLMLRAAVEDAGNFPVELFDACTSASRRLSIRIGNGECPPLEQDALIADYQTRIQQAGADIFANDPMTQEVIAARPVNMNSDAFIEAAHVIRQGVTIFQPITEGLLANSLPRDAAVASDPNANPDDRKAAGYRLSSRIVRIALVIGGGAAGVAGTIVLVRETLDAIAAIPDILASPFYKPMVQEIYRWLGF